MADSRMMMVMIILYSTANYQASSVSLYSHPSLSEVSLENLKSIEEAQEKTSSLWKSLPFGGNINEFIVVKEPEVMADAVLEDIQNYYSQLKSSIINLIEEETPELITSDQTDEIKLPERSRSIIIEDPVQMKFDYSNSEIESSFYSSSKAAEIPAIVIAKTHISNQFRKFKDLNPGWVWAIIICVITISLTGLVYLFIMCLPCKCCQRTKPSDHIESISFQTLQDFNYHPGPLALSSNMSTMTENKRNNRIGSINMYNIGYDYIYSNTNDSHSKDYIMPTRSRATKQMFKTKYLPISFKKQRRSNTNTFKQMDELLQAYYSLDIYQ